MVTIVTIGQLSDRSQVAKRERNDLGKGSLSFQPSPVSRVSSSNS